MQRRLFVLAAPLALVGCAGESIRASDDAVSKALYRADAPPSLTLFTVKNVGTENGAHTGLMINASQRVIFDPAGSYGHPSIPERDDVLFGITPQVETSYTSYHARASYFVVVQQKLVPAEVAERALQLALSNGPVAKANCTRATARLLKQLPGFDGIGTTWFPDNLMKQFATLPGVATVEHNENDSDSLVKARQKVDATLSSSAAR